MFVFPTILTFSFRPPYSNWCIFSTARLASSTVRNSTDLEQRRSSKFHIVISSYPQPSDLPSRSKTSVYITSPTAKEKAESSAMLLTTIKPSVRNRSFKAAHLISYGIFDTWTVFSHLKSDRNQDPHTPSGSARVCPTDISIPVLDRNTDWPCHPLVHFHHHLHDNHCHGNCSTGSIDNGYFDDRRIDMPRCFSTLMVDWNLFATTMDCSSKANCDVDFSTVIESERTVSDDQNHWMKNKSEQRWSDPAGRLF